jgi:hypothetical protein
MGLHTGPTEPDVTVDFASSLREDGQTLPPPKPHTQRSEQSRKGEISGMAIASLVLSLLWMWGVGSVLAIIFGRMGERQCDEEGRTGRGMATAGKVIGICGLILTGVVAILIIVAALSMPDTPSYSSY